jgi:uncharacterized protein
LELVAEADYIVRDNPEKARYEILRDGALVGGVWYSAAPGVVTLIHTEVAQEVEGGGIGSRLVAGALGDIRARGLRVVPLCPFVRAYLRRHPEQRDLIALDPATAR